MEAGSCIDALPGGDGLQGLQGATRRHPTCAGKANGPLGPADAAGWTSVQTVRQARLDPSSTGYRRPPEGWEPVIAKLSRERAADLVKLAEELEG